MKRCLMIAFVVGQCVQILTGILQNTVWQVAVVNENGTYKLQDQVSTIDKVPGRYLISVDAKYCEDIKDETGSH